MAADAALGGQPGAVLLAHAHAAMLGTLLFFCTGHFSEFAGLHYTAGAAACPVSPCVAHWGSC